MKVSEEAAYDETLSQAPLRQLGEAHVCIIRSAREMHTALYEETVKEHGFKSSRWTDFGRLVAADEIAWWVRERIGSLDILKARTVEAREALQKLLNDAKALQSKDAPATYLGLVESVGKLCNSRATQIGTFLDFVKWLQECDQRGPSILFTYKIWGSSRLADRDSHDALVLSDDQQVRICTEWALGFRTGSMTTLRQVTLDVSADIADSIDPETYSGPIEVTYERTSHRVAGAVTDNLVTYFELLRNSCRDLEIEIEKAEELGALFDSEEFWQAFVREVVKTNRTEETWWDLKQSLEMWHRKGPEKRLKEQDFCERIAAFANTDGGVLVIGVGDAQPRKIFGVEDAENRITHIYSSIRSHLDIAAPGMKVKEVLLDDEAGERRACLMVGIAKSPHDISVRDEAGKLSYPERQGPGMVLSDPTTIGQSKQFQKGYNWEFMNHLRKIARTSG